MIKRKYFLSAVVHPVNPGDPSYKTDGIWTSNTLFPVTEDVLATARSRITRWARENNVHGELQVIAFNRL